MSTHLFGALNVCFYNVTYAFRMNLHPVIDWMSSNSFLEADEISEI